MGRKKSDINENDIIEVNEEYEKYDIETITPSKTGLQKIKSVDKNDIKTMVKLFYETQRLRIIANGTVTAGTKNNEEAIVDAFAEDVLDYKKIEKNISNQLQAICKSQEVGRWLLSIKGIGPVLAAGLLSYFDITKAEYASAFISYAGLNDNNRPWLGREKSEKILNEILDGRKTITDEDVIEYAAKTGWKYNYFVKNAYNEKTDKWSKSELVKASSKIPYNKELKVLLWKVGCSFEYQKNKEDSVYGRLLAERLTYETKMNEEGAYADQAKKKLEEYNIGKDTVAYSYYIEGKLPPAHIRMRALRWVEKILVSHLFEEMYRVQYNKVPPRYYALEHLEGEHNIDIEPEVPYYAVPENE